MKLVLVPSGEFMMGRQAEVSEILGEFPSCDPRWLVGEQPRHKVQITNPFFLGQHEVTLGQLRTFCREAKFQLDCERDGQPSWGYEKGQLVQSTRFRPWAPGWEIDAEHPAVYVSWNDAVAFCKWLSKKEGHVYRLPTEAEWEYACRAGSNARFCFGNNSEKLIAYANAADQARKKLQIETLVASFDKLGKKTDAKIPFRFLAGNDGYAWTAPVGKFLPNAFGLYDMHGNAWEWCADWYDEKYYANSPQEDPPGLQHGKARVARGGGYSDFIVDLRAANRYFDLPTQRNNHLGFRVVREQ